MTTRQGVQLYVKYHVVPCKPSAVPPNNGTDHQLAHEEYLKYEATEYALVTEMDLMVHYRGFDHEEGQPSKTNSRMAAHGH